MSEYVQLKKNHKIYVGFAFKIMSNKHIKANILYHFNFSNKESNKTKLKC